MDNKDILSHLESGIAEIIADNTSTNQKERYLVFQIEQKFYAFLSSLVKEVIIDSEIFFLPFVPPYIRGLLNRHGEPYTVIDLKMILEKESFRAQKFLILNLSRDHLAISITDIVEILEINSDQIHRLSSSETEYFSCSFTMNEEEVPVLDLKHILKRLENDL